MLRCLQGPNGRHAGTVDYHDRSISVRQGQKSMTVEISVKQLSRISEIHLIDIVIDSPARTASEMGNSKAIVGETSQPPAMVEPSQFFHQVDFIDSAWVTDSLDRPQEDSFGAVLCWFTADKDTHRRLSTRRHAVPHPKYHTLRLRALAKCTALPYGG